ncbi:MAG: hypothetical protein Q7R47_01125 [Candidatus Diapherotrites archaeon]|nr:hypothetical protein [Candidatus Diapherotrites archaeon]
MNPKTKAIIRNIRHLRIQGASEVRRAGVDALLKTSRASKAKNVSQYRADMEKTALELVRSRPTEPGLRTVVRVLLDGLFGFSDLAEARRQLAKKASAYEKDRKTNLEAIVKNAQRLFSSKTTVLTHCHSHTVEAVLIANRKKIDTVYATETRPLFQGRITAANLAKAGLVVVQIVDSAAFSVLPECDLFMTGADAVLANGAVVNKIGTHPISLAAKTQNVPHYVATSRFAFDPLTFFGWPEPIEERGFREVWPDKPSRVRVRNPAFDQTPPELVSGILTERGLLAPTLFAEAQIKEMDLVNHKKEFLGWMNEMSKK